MAGVLMPLLLLVVWLSDSHAQVIFRGPGETLAVQCEYLEKFKDYVKVWCKEVNPEQCNAIFRSTGTWTWQRTRVQDNKQTRMISVTIKKLTEEDTGAYWCGVFDSDEIRIMKRIELQISDGYLPEVITRTLGESLTASCAYPVGYKQHSKIWCREKFSDTCDPITSTASTSSTPLRASSGRTTILDDQQYRVISVTITNLTAKDAGIYWCGVLDLGEVKIVRRCNLKVSIDVTSTSKHTPTPANTQTPTMDGGTGSSQAVNDGLLDRHIIYICVGLGILLLITVIALFYVLWIRRRRMRRMRGDSDTLNPGPDVLPSRARSEDESNFSEMDSHEMKYASLTHHGGCHGDATYSNVGFARRLAAPNAMTNTGNVEYASLNL